MLIPYLQTGLGSLYLFLKYMEILKLFGEHLRSLRKERHLTQEDLSQKCQMYAPYVGEIERGEKNPTLITLKKIADGLGISLIELLAIPALEKNDKGKIMAFISETSPRKQKRMLKALHLMVD
jgi:transcriptional regulator with XRE-family HTH domain